MVEFIVESKHPDGKPKTYFKRVRSKVNIESFTKDKSGKLIVLKKGEKPLVFDKQGVSVI